MRSLAYFILTLNWCSSIEISTHILIVFVWDGALISSYNPVAKGDPCLPLAWFLYLASGTFFSTEFFKSSFPFCNCNLTQPIYSSKPLLYQSLTFTDALALEESQVETWLLHSQDGAVNINLFICFFFEEFYPMVWHVFCSTKRWTMQMNFILFSPEVSWHQDCWACVGSLQSQYLWAQVGFLCIVSYNNLMIMQTLFNWQSQSKSVQSICNDLDLKGTIQEAATFNTLLPIYNVIHPCFPIMGACWMVTVI